MIYKNKNFESRDYEATNIVFKITNEDEPQSETLGTAQIEWEPSSMVEMHKYKCQPLFRSGNATYYGYL